MAVLTGIQLQQGLVTVLPTGSDRRLLQLQLSEGAQAAWQPPLMPGIQRLHSTVNASGLASNDPLSELVSWMGRLIPSLTPTQTTSDYAVLRAQQVPRPLQDLFTMDLRPFLSQDITHVSRATVDAERVLRFETATVAGLEAIAGGSSAPSPLSATNQTATGVPLAVPTPPQQAPDPSREIAPSPWKQSQQAEPQSYRKKRQTSRFSSSGGNSIREYLAGLLRSASAALSSLASTLNP